GHPRVGWSANSNIGRADARHVGVRTPTYRPQPMRALLPWWVPDTGSWMLLRFVKGQLRGVVAYIRRPRGDPFGELHAIVGEQRTHGFLETRHIARHRRHEVIRTLLRAACSVAFTVRAARFFYQLAQRDGRSARLGFQPFPMPRQQGHFARYHAEFRTAATARHFGNFG